MLYFIAIEIKGEPAEFYKKIGGEVYQKFGVAPLCLKLPFHITIKPPFRYEGEVSKINRAIQDSVFGRDSILLKLSSLGSFRKRVIFVQPDASEGLGVVYDDVLSAVNVIPEADTKRKIISRKDKKFHASLVRFIPKSKFHEIYSYIQKRFPEGGWVIEVSEVSLLVQKRGAWEILSTVPLGKVA
ncbi:MAG: 2'-5' RNA ligase family protein [Patescibacteria group bacterium]